MKTEQMQKMTQNGTMSGEAAERNAPRPRTRPGSAPAALQSEFVWMNGELVPFNQATIHVLNPTLHYGPGVFEGIRCYATQRGPAVFRLHDHLERFVESIRILGLNDFGYGVEDLRTAVHRVVHANQFTACYIRPIFYLEGAMNLNLDSYRPAVAIAAWRWGTLLGAESLEAGVRMVVSSFTRMHPNASMTKAKISGQYVNSILAKTVAVRSGFDEAVMLDPDGYVAECTGENLFIVRNGVVITPPKAAVLEGITRDSLIALAQDAGYTVKEERISRDQLYIADEVFVCGTAAEVVPVREIDFRRIGTGKMGKVTRELQNLFFDTVRGKGRRSTEWLDYVMMEPLY